MWSARPKPGPISARRRDGLRNYCGALANNLTLSGGNRFIFSGADTYQGHVNVFTGNLTLNGNGSLLSTSGISLGAGTSLTLDNTLTNVNSRLASNVGINSSGGIINLIGNSGTPTTQTIGTLTVSSGASVVSASGTGSSLTLGAPAAALSRVSAAALVGR